MTETEKESKKVYQEAVQSLARIVSAVLETIREVGEAPVGVIYLTLQSSLSVDIQQFQDFERILLGTKLVVRKNDQYIWVGPKEGEPAEKKTV